MRAANLQRRPEAISLTDATNATTRMLDRGMCGGGLASLSLAGCLVLAGCHSATLTPQEAAGKHLYDSRCAHCHEDNDLALKKVPPDLHGIFRRAILPSGVAATDPEVKSVILKGKGMMPAFAGRFAEDQMDDLLAYLHSGAR
jgi:mono/diheme cytochrome c family protein